MNVVIKKIILVNLIIIVPVLLLILTKGSQTTSKILVQPSETQGVEKNTSVDSTEVIKVTPTVPDDKCIITINESKYDVTDFRKKHPGGDVFVCGSDMTTIFNGQHDTRTLNEMKPYLVE